MCRLVSLSPQYITPINHLYQKYFMYLEDDYNEDTIAGIIKRTYPFFWVILSDTYSFVGFVYLDNIIGNSRELFSGEISVCAHPKFWGSYTKENAQTVIQHCFKQTGIFKLKALVYPENSRVKALLKASGFQKEAELIAETKRKDKLQNIEVYSQFRKGI